MTALLWLTRDLRVHDQPALRAALDAGAGVVPVFCFDDRLLRGRHASGPRTQFLLECLADLDERTGGLLVVRHGPPERELPALAREANATALHFTADAGPFARRRIERVVSALDIDCVGHPGLHAVDDLDAVRTQTRDPYTVFSPFHRRWRQEPRRAPIGRPRAFGSLPAGVRKGALPTLRQLGLEQEVSEPLPGGETAARDRLAQFLRDGVGTYADDHDALGRDRTSRLSPYLHFGCLSPREIEQRLPRGDGPEAFRRQLAWRDFYHHVLLHFPRNARSEFQPRYRGTLAWSRAERRFAAWQEGNTGYPLVDAGMRQLRREGWMHNRARLVVGSFLTKHLGIDWRWGERHFMRLLIDGDEANNNGNWQWIASVGVDPQPPFRRIYNPARQMERHDPDGRYVRRYVPELRAVPARHLAEPWTMPAAVQRACGCVIGRDYPEPIVDHAAARRAALERYAAAR
ncbi:MAG TPA: deoxyribodipyrimidine photo-lyase [Solirubrobacteraceae bacterium]|nr:deoxyribodipyrimidine photo-lyase [Solirubrobacteraceae bacterium]